MDKDLIEYGGKTENFDPRIVIFEGSPRPSCDYTFMNNDPKKQTRPRTVQPDNVYSFYVITDGW